MSQGQSAPRIKSGPPWWLWILLVVVTLAVIITVGVTSIPDNPQQLYTAAVKGLESNDGEAFTENLEKLRKFPEYAAHVSYLDGRAAARSTRDIKALEFFQAAVTNDELKPVVLEEIAQCQTRMGEFTAAIETYEEAIAAAGGSSQSAQLSLAGLYYSVGALGLAESTLNELLEADPSHQAGIGLRGTIRMDFGRYPEAIADFQSLLSTPGSRASADPKVVSGCCQCLLKIGSPEQLQAFLTDNGELLTDEYLKMRLKIAVGQTEDLSSQIAESVELSGNPLKNGLAKAALALAEDKAEDALSEVQRLFTMVTRDPDAFELAKAAYEKLDDQAAAKICEQNLAELAKIRAQFEDVIANECDNVTNFDARIKAGNLQKQMGNFEQAGKWFTMALLLAPGEAQAASEAMQTVFERLPMLVEFPPDVPTDTPTASEGDEKEKQEEKDSDKPADKPAEPDEAAATSPESADSEKNKPAAPDKQDEQKDADEPKPASESDTKETPPTKDRVEASDSAAETSGDSTPDAEAATGE